MKRIISAGLCTAFILSLAGCARQDTTPSLTAADTTDHGVIGVAVKPAAGFFSQTVVAFVTGIPVAAK